MEKNGNALVPQNYVTTSKLKLGAWVSTQREKCSQLSKSQISRLDGLGFVWDVREYKWNQMFSELERYVEKNGNAEVPEKYVSASKKKLGQWVGVQRQRSSSLSELRLERLSSIGFVWRVKK